MNATPDFLSMLQFTELFGGLGNESRQALARIALPKKLDKQQMLFCEGDEGHSVYILGSGKVRLYKKGMNHTEVIVKIVNPGEVFGEVVLFEQSAYPVSAMALVRSTVFLLPKHQFHCLLENRTFRNDFLTLLMAKQRFLTQRLHSMQSGDVRQRFFMFLRDHYGTRRRITVDMTKKELAQAVGTTPETFSRLLQQLKKEGILHWEGNTLLIYRGIEDSGGE